MCHLQRGGGEGWAGALANFPVSCVLTLGWGLESGGAQETFQGVPGVRPVGTLGTALLAVSVVSTGEPTRKSPPNFRAGFHSSLRTLPGVPLGKLGSSGHAPSPRSQELLPPLLGCGFSAPLCPETHSLCLVRVTCPPLPGPSRRRCAGGREHGPGSGHFGNQLITCPTHSCTQWDEGEKGLANPKMTMCARES